MNCVLPARGGTLIGVNGEHVTLINIVYQEECTMDKVWGIRLQMPNFFHHGSISVITELTMARMVKVGNTTCAPYVFSFEKNKSPIFVDFFEKFLAELRAYNGFDGKHCDDGFWIWTKEGRDAVRAQRECQAASKEKKISTESQRVSSVTNVTSSLEQRPEPQSVEAQIQKGPACPDCGCTSIFADKDETGAVVITCLNCGRKWHPGEHRSW